MSLTDRIAARECAVTTCTEPRVKDSLVCHAHLNEMFANRLDRTPTGFVPREPEWMRRRRTDGLAPKDFTGSAA